MVWDVVLGLIVFTIGAPLLWMGFLLVVGVILSIFED